MNGLIFDVQRFSLHDGPGIRTLIFFKGCPLRCTWCSNPEGQDKFINIFFLKDKCKKNCFRCVELCPNNALIKNETVVLVDSVKCNFCNTCIDGCHYGALKMAGQFYNADELVSIVKRDIKFYEKSDGGVTFSGGEPAGQINFLKVLVARLKNLGINLCLETCGYFNYDKCIETFRKMDLIYFDLKVIDDKEARFYTGKGTETVIRNLGKLSAENKEKIIVRVPLIPDITTKKTNLQKIRVLMEDNELRNIELMPFHKLGIKKYEMLGRKNELKEVRLIPEEELNSYIKFFHAFNVRVEK